MTRNQVSWLTLGLAAMAWLIGVVLIATGVPVTICAGVLATSLALVLVTRWIDKKGRKIDE